MRYLISKTNLVWHIFNCFLHTLLTIVVYICQIFCKLHFIKPLYQMECLSHKSEIVDTFSNIRSFSFQEKKTPLMDEDRVNSFLDAILDFKNELKGKADKIYDINEKIEKITWFNDLDEESLMLLNDLISAAKDLRTSLIRQYVSMNIFRSKGIAKDEIKDLKNSIDELKESYEDLESVFFFLPEMPYFVETTRKLSLV